MLRPARLAALLKVPVIKTQSELFAKSSGRLFMQVDMEFYAFLSTKQAMIPYGLAQDYSLAMYDKELPPFVSVNSARVGSFGSSSSSSKHVVSTLLGHFNHGKTTLLDSFIDKFNEQISNSNLNKLTSVSKQRNYVDQEKYGITQVYINAATFIVLISKYYLNLM